MIYTSKGAVISPDGKFRYRLWRRWDDSRPVLVFVMLNPSTADDLDGDNTMRKCVGFADRLGYGGIEIVNLFAYRTAHPAELKAAGWPVGPENDAHIKTVLDRYGIGHTIAAWGTNAACRVGWARVSEVVAMMEDAMVEPKALRWTANGVPWHPLYLPYDCEPVAFDPDTPDYA